jgi:hypothetical protein
MSKAFDFFAFRRRKQFAIEGEGTFRQTKNWRYFDKYHRRASRRPYGLRNAVAHAHQ